MCRVGNPRTLLLGFDLLSQIDTRSVERGDHCLGFSGHWLETGSLYGLHPVPKTPS